MHIGNLKWDEYRVEHIAEHDVTPDEVWEVCRDPFHLVHREGQNDIAYMDRRPKVVIYLSFWNRSEVRRTSRSPLAT